jgi:pimeloyl-ACP methyl ester carboxylesterase
MVDGVDLTDVAGLRLAYRRTGRGPPLVLLHGWLFDSRVWRRQLDALSDEFTVVAWDSPGAGESSDPPESFRLAEFADCLAGFLETLDLERPHILGWSFGGALALELCRRRPKLARTVVLTGGYAGWAGSLPAEVVRLRLERCLRESELPPGQFAPAFVREMLTPAAPEAMRAELESIVCDFHPVGYRAMGRSLAEADLREWLPRMHVPTLLLYGGADRRSPPTVGEAIGAAVPRSELVVLPAVRHACHIEAADRFNHEVRRFLRSAPT